MDQWLGNMDGLWRQFMNDEFRGRLIWITIGSVLVIVIHWFGALQDRKNAAVDRTARPEYYAHIEQFGDPITANEAIAHLRNLGYQDLDLSHLKGPIMVPEGWLLGLVFKSEKNPNDQLFWFVKVGKRGADDIKMYPGNKYPIPIYP
jgi:hypothetical protein